MSPESSDEEGPGEESFSTAKELAHKEHDSIVNQKRKEKLELKMKRQKQQEMFVSQKLDKAARLARRRNVLEEPELATISGMKIVLNSNSSAVDSSSAEGQQQHPKRASKRKFYKDYNIEVTTLDQLKDGRAQRAINFKARRLAKPHRESVLVNKVHMEKLRVAGKL